MQVKSKTDGLSSVINAHLHNATKQNKDWKQKTNALIPNWTNKSRVYNLQCPVAGYSTMVFLNNYCYVLKYYITDIFFHGFSNQLDTQLMFFLARMVILSNLYLFLILR